MKNLSVVAIAGLICFQCNTSSVKSADEEVKSDSLRSAISRDSLERVILDSLLRAQEALLKSASQWSVGNFVDAFGDPTKEKFIQVAVEGSFSNSATSSAQLFAKMLITKSDMGIFLHEYSMTAPPQKFIGSAQIQMKNEAGQTVVVNSSSSAWGQKGGIKVSNHIGDFYIGNCDKLTRFIRKSTGKIKVVIYDDYSSVYNFEIDSEGFLEQYNEIK